MKAKQLFPHEVLLFYVKRVFLLAFFMVFSYNNVSAQENERYYVNGGTISTTDDTTICVDGNPDPIDVTLENAYGRRMKWIITDDNNNILALPSEPPFDLDAAGPGVCRIWHISYIYVRRLRVGKNLSQLRGWFDLSNYISVTRNEPIGGTLEGGPFEFTSVSDGEPDNIPEGAISLSGNSGANSAWVITDADGNILGVPPTPYVVNFDVAGAGVCLVWHLSFEDGLEGAVEGNNALTDLVGCYDLSNPIEVIRTEAVVVEGGTLEGGPFEFCAGDGDPDNIPEGAITLTGNVGPNSAWVVTDSDGNILGLPPMPSVVNFDVAGDGVCLVWHLSFEDGLEGAVEGNNALTDLVGNYSLSNPISVVRNQPEGGTLEGGPFEFTSVSDGEPDNIPEGAISLSGNSGANSAWVITDADGNILGVPPTPYVVNFDVAGAGVCLVWHLSFEDGLEGAVEGNNALTDLVGCYDLSNPIEVIRTEEEVCDVDGGTIYAGGLYFFCEGDGNPDYATGITLNNNAGNSQWVVTDVQGNILGLPPSPEVVDFDVAGPGVCLIWHLSFDGDIQGAEMGNNAFSDLSGCYDLSNPIPVFRFPANSFICHIIGYSRESETIEIGMYPNPAEKQVNLDMSDLREDAVMVKVYDFTSTEIFNQKVDMRSLNKKPFGINVSKFNTGFYLVSISDMEGNIKSVKRLLIK